MKKILIVDDEPNIVILMEQILEELEEENNVVILTARNGQDALKIIQEEKPNLVFLDVMMPHLSGLEVCKIVKHNFNMVDTYIILLTARGQSCDQEQGMAMGANCYMTKPFRPKEVLRKSKEILGLDPL